MHDGGVSFFDRHPRVRWAVPAAAGLLVLAGTAIGTAGVSADAGLPAKTAQELLVDLQSAEPGPVSGTVEISSDLGLPDLSMLGGAGSTDPTSLLSGTHTLRVWSDGGANARVDLLAERSEYDMVVNGQDVWLWDSSTSTVEHYVMPEGSPTKAPASEMSVPKTPQEAAELVLTSIDPTTEVSVSGSGSVAGRPVYELSLTPRQDGTKIARVVMSVDAETGSPLRVQAFSAVTQAPAFDVGFTTVDFTTPDASVFAFTPPPGADVTEHSATDGPTRGDGGSMASGPQPTMVGEGWTSVLVAAMPADQLTDNSSDSQASAADLIQALPSVSGPWGSGRLLDGTLFSAIITDDGRMAVGAVTPEVLETALAQQ